MYREHTGYSGPVVVAYTRRDLSSSRPSLALSCLFAAHHDPQHPYSDVAQGGKGSLVKCFVERIVEDATEGDLKCPECGSEFARPAMIRGKPANKIIGGKVIMRK